MRAVAAAFLPLCALLLAACAAGSYAGVPLARGAADPELQALARRAQTGDKPAQLELGIRYEEGRGVPRDLARAIRLYELAANSSTLTRVAYVPATAPGGRAMTMPVGSGIVDGIPEARWRLQRLGAAKAGAGTSPARLAPAPAAGDPVLPSGVARTVASEAFAELVVLDQAHERCVRTGGDFEAMRPCFHAAILPADCREYFRSIENAAELVANRGGAAALAPAAVEFLNACREGASPRLSGDSDRLESSLSPVEWLLGRRGRPDPRPLGVAPFPPGQMYISRLCSGIIEGRLRDFHVSELLFCTDTDTAQGELETYRQIIRHLLRNGE